MRARFWHAHMLSPGSYRRDCERLLGRLLPHTPWSVLPLAPMLPSFLVLAQSIVSRVFEVLTLGANLDVCVQSVCSARLAPRVVPCLGFYFQCRPRPHADRAVALADGADFTARWEAAFG